jgi:hypothetical protein
MPASLRRYTSLPGLLYLLQKRALTLLDPRSWEDSNDSHYLKLYETKAGLKTVRALCFTQADETYHHWRVFAPGSSGVCIRFRRPALLRATKGQEGLAAKSVLYRTLTTARRTSIKTAELPFLKRIAFKGEEEFRLIYGSTERLAGTLDLPIPLSAIDRIILNPWIAPALSDQVKRTIKGIRGCAGLKVVRSTLISNAKWKELGDRAK